MKKALRFLALLLCAATLLVFASCVKDRPEGIPDGMQLACAENADFRLYVPTTWNPNTDYGVSGAYFNLSTQTTVSVVKYPITDAMRAQLSEASIAEDNGEARIDWYWSTQCRPALEAVSLGGSFSDVEEKTSTLLGDANAWRYHCKGHSKQKQADVHFVQVIAERENAFYVFSYTAEEARYEACLPDVESMLDVFVFAEPYTSDEYAKPIDKEAEAPEGMMLASNDDVAYRFYVPTDWTVDPDQTVFAAFASDGSSVSVVPYMPTEEGVSAEAFFESCKEALQGTADNGGFEVLEESDTTLGGRNAKVYVYRYAIGGNEYRYKQVIAVYKSMVYSLTYTARNDAEIFNSHLADVDRMIAAFQFR